jgi:hypothetical protein
MVLLYSGPVALILAIGLTLSFIVLYYHDVQQIATLNDYGERLTVVEGELTSEQTEVGTYLKLDTDVKTASTYTFPDVGTSADVVMTEGEQTVNGVKTFPNGMILGSPTNYLFDQYQVTVADIIFEGPWPGPILSSVQIIRIGKLACMHIHALAIATVSAHITFGMNIANFAPISTFLTSLISVHDDQHPRAGILIYDSDTQVASVYVQNGTSNVSFTGAGSSGIVSPLTYMVN